MEIKSQHKEPMIEILHAELPPQYARVPHSSSETLFLFCESGHGIATVNFSRYRICRGSFIPVFSDAFFEINRLSANTRFLLIRLDDKLFDEVAFRLSADFWDFWMDNPVLYLSAEQNTSVAVMVRQCRMDTFVHGKRHPEFHDSQSALQFVFRS